MPKVTDNEKAATFIGWNHERCELRRILEHHPKDWCDRHKRYEPECPDMTQPQNWARALVALMHDGHWWELHGSSDGIASLRIDPDGDDSELAFHDGDSISAAIIRTLAALYRD